MPVFLVQGAVPGADSQRCVSLDPFDSVGNSLPSWTTVPLVPCNANCVYAASGVIQCRRITRWEKNSTHVIFHDNLHKLTSYMAGHKSFEEYPEKKAKCEMDLVWRRQNSLKQDYHLRSMRS